MGLTIHYTFRPELPSDFPLENPVAASEHIQFALGVSAGFLSRLSVPYQVHPLRDLNRTWGGGEAVYYEQGIELGGVAKGCEHLTFGWTRIEPLPWSGQRFIKTQYAADFPAAHHLVCEVLGFLEDSGIISNVEDEAGYYRSGKGRDHLVDVYARSQAQLGQIQDWLQGMGAGYKTHAPGGDTIEFPGGGFALPE